jgi:hypothetical protein
MATVADAVILAFAESVPVTVKVYVPAVVAGVLVPVVWPPPPPPQPTVKALKASRTKTSIDFKRRRREGIPNMRTTASNAPPPLAFHKLLREGPARAEVEAAVV